MKTETLGEPHQPAALLRVQTPDAPVDQIHSGLRPDSTPEGRERNGVPFGAVDAFPLPALAHRADAQRSVLSLRREFGSKKEVGPLDDQFLELRVIRRKKNVFDRDVFVSRFRELKSRNAQILAETDEVYALALLSHPVARSIEDGVMNFVTETFKQFEGRFQSTPIGMAEKILNVLQKKNSRAMVAGDAQDFVQERTPGIFEPALVPRDAERLTGEAPAKQIVTGDVSRRNSRKVARRFLPEILSIGQAGVRIKI